MTIKMISTKRYVIELIESGDLYMIRYVDKHRDFHEEYSELMADYNMASFLFDIKIEELEGN